MPVYQIKDWNTHFENNKSKSIVQCSWVRIPNKQHGMGFIRITNEPDGAAIFGIWQMTVQAVSQQKSPRDGWLTDDGKPNGRAWSAQDLALRFRRPLAEIERMLEVVTSKEVGWAAAHGQLSRRARAASALEVPLKCPSDAPSRTRVEQNRTEQNGTEDIPRAALDGLDGVADVITANTWTVFRHWQDQMGHPEAKLTEKRSKAVRCRLQDGYTVEQLKRAIDGCKSSDFHMGRDPANKSKTMYDGLTLICRDGDHVESFIQRLDEKGNGSAAWDEGLTPAQVEEMLN